MNIQIQIQVCRACLKPPETTKLVEYSQDSEILQKYYEILSAEPTLGLPRTFCEKCIAKIKLSSSFKKSSLASEHYLKSFVVKINQEFTKSLPTISTTVQSQLTDDDPELEELLFEERRNESQEPQATTSSITPAPLPATAPALLPPRMAAKTVANPSERILAKKVEKPKPTVVKIEKAQEQKNVEAYRDVVEKRGQYQLQMQPPEMFDDDDDDDDEDQLDDDGNIFGEEIYDIMEIDNEGESEKIYLDESGKHLAGDEDGEFILVNFKSSNEDLSEKDSNQQYVVEEVYDDAMGSSKVPRKKHVNRMPKEIIEKYAQTIDNNRHVCTKCLKTFSTRTNLIRHIQSHDGHKAYVCHICQKGFTQSGSLKQHMYIHSGERPYKCNYCDRAFTQGKTLKFHLRRHTEEKPFICTECNSAFRQRDGLKRHLKSRHNIELVYERHNQLHESSIKEMSEEKILPVKVESKPTPAIETESSEIPVNEEATKKNEDL